MTKATKLLALAESDDYNYLLGQTSLCAKRGCLSMGLSRDIAEYFKKRLQADGFEVCSMTQ